jgi:hypothetical protein
MRSLIGEIRASSAARQLKWRLVTRMFGLGQLQAQCLELRPLGFERRRQFDAKLLRFGPFRIAGGSKCFSEDKRSSVFRSAWVLTVFLILSVNGSTISSPGIRLVRTPKRWTIGGGVASTRSECVGAQSTNLVRNGATVLVRTCETSSGSSTHISANALSA